MEIYQKLENALSNIIINTQKVYYEGLDELKLHYASTIEQHIQQSKKNKVNPNDWLRYIQDCHEVLKPIRKTFHVSVQSGIESVYEYSYNHGIKDKKNT